MDALGKIIDVQAEEAKAIPVTPVGRVRRGNRRSPKVVDLTLRHYAGHGLGDKTKEKLKKANKEYKAEEKKIREGVFKYNHEGIAKHGIAWNHMNRKQREARFKELLMSDQRMPPEVIGWAKQRGLM
jgi:hypothetical protein